MQKMALAFAFANGLSHDELLNWYVHRVYLGQGCYGVEDAARAYFGTTLSELGLPQVALLAGLARAPRATAPDAALARRNGVLRAMAKAGRLTDTEEAAACAAPLALRAPLGTCDTRWVPPLFD